MEQHGEYSYLNLLKRVYETGDIGEDRTAIGTKSLFGEHMRFDLTKGFPLLTTKRVFWKGVVEELLFFLKGETNSKLLEQKGVNIWKGNTSREFLDKRGLNHLPAGDIGSGYGFQWRHWNAIYKDCTTDYTGQGIDQIRYIVSEIKNSPTSRRIYFSAWNPSALNNMALPPCHLACQFRVLSGGRLSCSVYIRSNDLFLGAPFNIASYALLTHIIASACGLVPQDLILNIGDAHIYCNHLEQVKEQLSRKPLPFPTLTIADIFTDDDTVDSILTKIEGLLTNNFTINGYTPHPAIKAEMAV